MTVLPSCHGGRASSATWARRSAPSPNPAAGFIGRSICHAGLADEEDLMSGTKVMWAQLALVLGLTLLGLWAATEWVAWRLAYQSELGRPWFVAMGWPVYPPPAFFWWWFAFDA